MVRGFFQFLTLVIVMCSSFVGAKNNEQQLTPEPTDNTSLFEVITSEIYTPKPNNEPIFEYEEEGITLSKCLAYRNEQWRKVEESFEQEVLMVMPYEYKIYDASELSSEILENRNGAVIVERCIGFVTNRMTGDGKLLNARNKEYNYISYRSVTEQKYYDGTVFISYMLYNPENNYIDDITERYDFAFCREWED